MTNEKAQKKIIKEALQNDVKPYVLAIKEKIAEGNALLKELVAKPPEERDANIEAMAKSIQTTNDLLQEILADSKKKESEDWTFEVSKELAAKIRGEKGDQGKQGKEGKKGKDGYTPVFGKDFLKPEEIEAFLKSITPVKGKHYRDGKDGVTKTIIVKDDTKISPEEIRDKLESIKPEKSKLRITAISGLKEILDRLGSSSSNNNRPSSGLGGSGGGSSSGGGGTWGTIQGNISDQTDLAAALAAKLNISDYVEYTDEKAQDAVGAMIDSTLSYSDITPSLGLNMSNPNTWSEVQSFDTILGAEKIVNGTPTSATSWTLPSGWAYSSNAFVHGSNGTGGASQNATTVAGESYVLTYTVSNLTAGTVTPSIGGMTLTARSTNGTYTENVYASTSANLTFTPSNTARLSISNISLKRVTGGGVKVTNTRNATAVNPSTVSAPVAYHASAWRSNPVANLQSIDFLTEARGFTDPIQPTGEWALRSSVNGASYTDVLKVSTSGKMTSNILTGVGETVGHEIIANFANASPATTQHSKYSNSSGGFTYLTFYFNSVLRAAIGTDFGGGMSLYTSNSNGVVFYSGSAGLTTPSAYSYNTPSQFIHQYSGNFGGGVSAGSQSIPTSTLQSHASLALKVKRLTANGNIDNSATHWLLDATSASSCTGTPSNSCSAWGSESECLKWDAHGGCYWNAGNDCSAFNGDVSTCGSTSGCSVSTASCSGAGDESSCYAQDDSYGGDCAWTESFGDCSSFDESTCGGTSGCSQNFGDCSPYSDGGGDGSACMGYSASCSYDSMSGSCSGAPYIGCSGSYSSGYSCTGTYNTGGCTGTYGSGCFGTPSCAGIDDSTNCGNETGCTWSSILTAQLPDGELSPDRTYFLYNDSSGGADVKINPHSGQTIDGASSLTLASFKEWAHIAYFKKTADCSAFNGDQSTCTSTSGCSAIEYDCGGNNSEENCVADPHCTWNGSYCDGGTHYHGCSGTYALSKNWYVFGR